MNLSAKDKFKVLIVEKTAMVLAFMVFIPLFPLIWVAALIIGSRIHKKDTLP